MAKQVTDNLQLITLDDVDTDSWFADYVINLIKLNNADKQRQVDLAAEVTRAEAAEQALASGTTGAVGAETTRAETAEQALATALANELAARAAGDTAEATARANAIAALFVGGKIDPNLLPAISLDRPPFVVTSQTAMLALAAQVGDIAKRTDLDGGTSLMLGGTGDPTQLANWVRLSGDYALTSDLAAEVTRAQTAEATKQPLDTDLTTIAALDSTSSGVMASDGSGWLRKTYSQLKTALGLSAADIGAQPASTDAIGTRTLSSLANFADFVNANGLRGHVGEVGWPNTVDNASWQAIGEAFYDMCDAAGLDVTYWSAGFGAGSNYNLLAYSKTGANTDTLKAPSSVIEAHLTTNNYDRGINVPGAEFTSTGFSNVNKGTWSYPTAGDFTYLAGRGVKIVRMPFRWERIQPTLGSALDSAELTSITAAVNAAGAVGIKVILDCHNYAGYYTSGPTLNTLGDSILTQAAYNDLWTRLSTAFKSNAAVIGYDIMNEPKGMSAPNTVFTAVSTIQTFDTDVAGFSTVSGTGPGPTWDAGTTYSIGGSAKYSPANGDRIGETDTSVRDRSSSGLTFWCDVYVPSSFVGSPNAAMRSQNSGFSFLDNVGGAQFVSLAKGNTTRLYLTLTTAQAQAMRGVFLQMGGSGYTGGDSIYVTGFYQGNRTSDSRGAAGAWEDASNAVIAAIRANGDTKRVYVQGYAVYNTDIWGTPAGHTKPWVVDSGNNFAYSHHQYFDTPTDGGTYPNSYATTLASVTALGWAPSSTLTSRRGNNAALALTREASARAANDALALQKTNNLADLANTATARANLGLGTAATQPTSTFDAAGAAAAAQAAAQTYASNAVSTALAGLAPAEFPAQTQGSGLTHSGVGQTVGGVVVTAGMRVLDTATTSSSGLWVAGTGAWSRPGDFATGSNAQGKLVEVVNGALWLCIAATAVTVDTTSQVWTEIDASVIAAGTGLTKSGNTINLALTKALVTATGLTYSDVGADQAGAAASVAAANVGSNQWLTGNALSQAFIISGAPTYDATYGTLTATAITWPDGTAGAYAITSLDNNGAVLGFTATYAGTTTRTVSVTIPRNSTSQVNAAVTVAVA